MSLSVILNSGKNRKLPYYLKNVTRLAVPDSLYRKRLDAVLSQVARRRDRDYIYERVAYYNRLSPGAVLPADSPAVGDLSLKGNKSVYYFDTREFSRWFDPSLRWNYLFGDITQVPGYASILKSRPIHGDNSNSVLLNLVKVRHFIFLDDSLAFWQKDDRAIFRGKVGNKPNRVDFMKKFHGQYWCDACAIPDGREYPAGWVSGKISLWDHLKFKFILALEGNDVASNLKWVMSSNSLAVSPAMKYETWFMEGRLRPGEHYVGIAGDYSNLREKMDYYISHPKEAREITQNANRYVEQFRDPLREKLISLLVLDKYFRMTGQR